MSCRPPSSLPGSSWAGLPAPRTVCDSGTNLQGTCEVPRGRAQSGKETESAGVRELRQDPASASLSQLSQDRLGVSAVHGVLSLCAFVLGGFAV